jgi:phage tail-like protein
MSPGKRKEPFGAYHFLVEIDGEHIAYPFRSCTGLKSEATVVDVQEGGFNTFTHKLIGQTKFPNIVLKRGFCGATSELYTLRQKFTLALEMPGGSSQGAGFRTPTRFSGIITQLGPNGSCAKWRFTRAWICKWEGPEFDASKNEISIESIEIAHEGLAMLPNTSQGS